MDFYERHSIRGVLRSVKALGWEPATVIDVGVAMGTEGLYEVWPSANICLIDPVQENVPYMEQIKEKYPNVISLCVAASDQVGIKKSRVNLDLGYATVRATVKRSGIRARLKSAKRVVKRLFRRANQSPSNGNAVNDPNGNVVRRIVPVTTLDRVVEEYDLQSPYIVKIDTDSHEREIIVGGRACLARAEICIIEATKFGGPGRITFKEIFDLMADAGLDFYDFAGPSYGTDPEVRPLRLIDLVFVRAEGEVYRLTAARSSKGDKRKLRIQQRTSALKQNPYL